MRSRWVTLGFCLYACQPAAPAVESNELGITEVAIERSQVQGERLLTVRGLDRDGGAIATATLRTGMVLYGADMPAELHAGTELTVTVRDTNARFIDPDRVPHVIYEPLAPSIATFVGLRAVASAIDKEAGIQFAPPPIANGEIAFTAGTCDGSRFPINKGGSTSCCQDTSNTYHVNAANAVANRFTYAPSYPSVPVCRKSDGTTGCTTNCLYGPCGSAVGSVSGTNGHVFVPTSNPNVCGWDTGGAGGLGVDYSPENYSSQTLWGSLTASCGCFACNSDGTAVCATFTYVKESSTNDDDSFGHHVAVSADGNTVAVYGLDDWYGGVTIFVYSGGTWSEQAYLQASNKPYQSGQEFGYSLALSDDGNTLAVGAPFESSNATGINGDQTNTSAAYSGAAFVFTRSGTTWTQEAYVKASNTGADDQFGAAVALSSNGNTLAVGSIKEDSDAVGINGNQNDESASNTGAVYVYTRSGTTWTQEAYVKASNPDAGDWFGGSDDGHSIALSDDGNTMAVGATLESSGADGINGNQSDNSQEAAGAVYVFTRSGTTWCQQAYIKASNSFEWTLFGHALALAGDGNTLAVGSPRENSSSTGINGAYDSDSASAGAVYVFTRSGSTWSQQAFVKASNTGAYDRFGYSVALDGNLLAVGAETEDSNAAQVNGDQTNNSATDAGAVYRFSRVGSTWSQDRYIKASNPEADDRFGAGVAIVGSTSSSTLVVGARREDSNASGIGGNQTDNSDADSGAVYIIR